MWSYVNHHAMSEIFRPLELEPDPAVRATLLENIETEFANRLLNEYERATFDLKKLGWNTGQIAEALSISERKVKTLIRLHAENTGQFNPLAKRGPAENVIDITHLVRRTHHPLATQGRAPEEQG